MTKPVGNPGRIENGLDWLRRLLAHRVSVGALIEAAVWLAIPYLCIGMVWAFLHGPQVDQIEARLARVSPVATDIGAFGVTTLFWPASLQIANSCPAG